MRLFGKKKKEVVEENPYAAPITPYQQARANLTQSPKAGGPGGLPSNPRANSFASTAPSFASSTAPPPYVSPATTYDSPATASDSSRFGDEKYGNQNGYGSNRYDSQPRSGGYGGFGDDAGNNDLFGGASGRYVPPQQGSNGSPSMQSPGGRYNNDPSKSTLLGNAQDRYNPLPPTQSQDSPADDEYGGYGAPRELTGKGYFLLQTMWFALLTQHRGGEGQARNSSYQPGDQKHQKSRCGYDETNACYCGTNKNRRNACNCYVGSAGRPPRKNVRISSSLS